MFQTIDFHYLRNDEIFLFSKRILKILDGIDRESLQLDLIYDWILEAFKKLDTAISKEKGNQITTNVNEKDIRRDKAYIALRDFVSACFHRLKPEWEEPAGRLIYVLKKYGWSLHSKSYSNQSSRLENLLGELERKPKLREAIVTINATEWVNELKKAQRDFRKAQEDQQEEASRKPSVTTAEARLELKRDIRNLLQVIEALHTVTRNEDYLQLADQINEVIEQTMFVVKGRIARSLNQKEEIEENL